MKKEMEEYERVVETGQASDDEDMDDAEESAPPAIAGILPNALDDPEVAEFKMEGYDEEGQGVMMTGAGMKGLMYYENQEGDPYVVMNDDSGSEKEDWQLKPSDSLIIVAKTEEEIATLEVHVYEEAEDNLYCHHDIIITAFPLCLAWTDFTPPLQPPSSDSTIGPVGNKGNFIAVGSFNPGVEIWNLDIVDAPSPVATLGGAINSPIPEAAEEPEKPEKKKKGKKKAAKKPEVQLREGSHRDAVMCLSWNKLQRNIIASGSADHSVKVWDMSSATCVLTSTEHTDKVQACAFHPSEASILASAAYDRSVRISDLRSRERNSRWTLSADAEAVAWNLHDPNQLFASSEDGNILCIDVRTTGKPLYTLNAHHGATNTITLSPSVPGLLATGSVDKTVKLWDVRNGRATLVDTLTDSLGTVFASGFCGDSGLLLGVGGGKGILSVLQCAKRAS